MSEASRTVPPEEPLDYGAADAALSGIVIRLVALDARVAELERQAKETNEWIRHHMGFTHATPEDRAAQMEGW
jgi:predicted ATP-grasp superfamily ATP-dependent carboligase